MHTYLHIFLSSIHGLACFFLLPRSFPQAMPATPKHLCLLSLIPFLGEQLSCVFLYPAACHADGYTSCLHYGFCCSCMWHVRQAMAQGAGSTSQTSSLSIHRLSKTQHFLPFAFGILHCLCELSLCTEPVWNIYACLLEQNRQNSLILGKAALHYFPCFGTGFCCGLHARSSSSQGRDLLN